MTGKQPAPPSVRAEVKRLVEKDGDKAAAESIGIGTATVARVLAGLDVSPGTLALLRERFSEQDAKRKTANGTGDEPC